MSAEAFTSSNPAAVIDRLATAMVIEHKIGAAAEALLGAPPRITWVPPERGGIAVENAPFGLIDRDVYALQAQRFDVTVFASSYTELLALHGSLVIALDNACGPENGQLPTLALDGVARAGYAIGDPSSLGPVESATVSGAWACVVPVTLKDFIARRQLTTTAPIEDVPLTITSTDINGQNEQPGLASDQT